MQGQNKMITNIKYYKWSPYFKWTFMIRKMVDIRNVILGWEITIFNWEIRIYKDNKLIKK